MVIPASHLCCTELAVLYCTERVQRYLVHEVSVQLATAHAGWEVLENPLQTKLPYVQGERMHNGMGGNSTLATTNAHPAELIPRSILSYAMVEKYLPRGRYPNIVWTEPFFT